MRYCRFLRDNKPYWGVIEGDDVVEMDAAPYSGGVKKSGKFALKDVKLLAPVEPTKIVAVGLNYKAHAAEFGKPLPDVPLLFIKPSTAIIGSGDSIIYPSHMSHRVDYEGELAIVIGRRTKDVTKAGAPGSILGYTCINDVTARDLQGKDGQFTRAKGFDTFAPIGPWIETELDPQNIRIETFLNGEKRQDTSTSDMIFGVYEIVSFVSQVMTLLPGDVIATGTPSGVGKMKPGDLVEVVIEGIGRLGNSVKDREA